MNLNLWLNVSADKKGARDVRVLTGGLITTMDDSYPVPYGDGGTNLDGDDRRAERGGGVGGASLPAADVNKTSSARPSDPAEDVSL